MDGDDTPDLGDRLLTLEFDFLKHLTSLALATIGGAVTLAGSFLAALPDKRPLWLATGAIAVAGGLAFQAQHRLLRDARLAGRPSRTVRIYREIAAGLYGLGMGFLLAIAYGALR